MVNENATEQLELSELLSNMNVHPIVREALEDDINSRKIVSPEQLVNKAIEYENEL